MYNFISTFDELNKLYEEVDSAKLTEAAEDEAVEDEIVEDEMSVEETSIEEPVVDEEPRQVICECDKCGALVIKDEADIVVDEETDLVNIEDECQFCEEAKGYKIVGVVAPYEVAEVEDEPVEEDEIIDEAFESFKKSVQWSKLKNTHTLQVISCKDIKKGDMINLDDSNPAAVEDSDYFYCVAKITFNGDDIDIKFGSTTGVNYADVSDKCLKAVPKKVTEELIEDDDLIDEDLADVARKVFDKPASTKTQQAWEDELNGEMGEISDKRRAHLERKFAQQRDWEARHEADKK